MSSAAGSALYHCTCASDFQSQQQRHTLIRLHIGLAGQATDLDAGAVVHVEMRLEVRLDVRGFQPGNQSKAATASGSPHCGS